MRAKHFLPALLLPVLLGCSANAGGIDVDGETFSGAEVTGYELAPDTQISLTFSGEQVSANAGCNTLFGQGSWEGSELHVEELASTEMGCDSALHDQDEWLAGFLQSTPVASLEGATLTLTSGDDSLTLTREEDAELEGTRWRLDGLERNEAISSMPQGVEASLKINDGQAEIDFGCNTGGGEVTVTEGQLEFGELIRTLKGCEEDATEVETQMLSVLQGTVDYEIDRSQLRIGSGDERLHFITE